MKILCTVKRNEGQPDITSCVRNAFQKNAILKERKKLENEE